MGVETNVMGEFGFDEISQKLRKDKIRQNINLSLLGTRKNSYPNPSKINHLGLARSWGQCE